MLGYICIKSVESQHFQGIPPLGSFFWLVRSKTRSLRGSTRAVRSCGRPGSRVSGPDDFNQDMDGSKPRYRGNNHPYMGGISRF